MTNPTTGDDALTTLTKYAGQFATDYDRMPTIDVPIIDPPATCATCGKPVHLVPDSSLMSRWAHTDIPTPIGTSSDHAGGDHYVSVRRRCRYCGTDDPTAVHFHQHPWYDAVECDRCGGVSGRAIGD